MSVLILLLVGVLALAVGFGLGFLVRAYVVHAGLKEQQEEAERRLDEAEKKAKEIVLSAKDEALSKREEAERELERRRSGLRREEERLQGWREKLDDRQERLERREQSLNKRQSALDRQRNQLEQLENEKRETLKRLAGLSREEAREELLASVEKGARQDMARVIRQVEAEALEEADKRARKVITTAIQRIASEHVAQVTVSTVSLPSDDMKGRIIGRGGRNIRAFEKAAGVDVVVDDTPEAVTISCFDPVRREVARRAMERLVLDGRIHPTNIERFVKDSDDELGALIGEEGKQAAYEAGVHGLPSQVTTLIGRLKFRTSYGQNQYAHAVETSKLAGMIAEELGADADVARAGGLLHDIGKAVDFENEGTHVQIGAEICRRHGIRGEVVHCVEAHHNEMKQNSVEAVIVEAADAISGARPGARRESLEFYLKRVRTMEEIAQSFSGVEEAYALQAGREIRVIVRPQQIDDLGAIRLSKDIAGRLEGNMEYPGQIKVTVIREVRAEEYAK
ncbi:MAG: ribonuclease Y [Anaerolineae bacterium]|jgi:ribonuclease Y